MFQFVKHYQSKKTETTKEYERQVILKNCNKYCSVKANLHLNRSAQ